MTSSHRKKEKLLKKQEQQIFSHKFGAKKLYSILS